MTRAKAPNRRRGVPAAAKPIKLWRMAPSPSELQRIYRDARRAVRYWHSKDSDPVLAKQAWLRAVSEEYGRRLAAAGIYVEGETS